MPGSFPVFDAVVRHLVTLLVPQRALDIGTGAGKYGRLLADAAPGCHRTGVEVEPSYVQAHDLQTLYHRLDLADATQWWRQHPSEAFDLVLLGDCIEHMPKSAGLDLLNAMVYRCGYLLVVAPEFIVQGAVDGVAAETHLSVWSERDLHWHDLWAWDNCRATTLMLLRGYLPTSLPMEALIDQLNAADLPLRHFDGVELVRPARLRLVAHRREVDYRHL
jgi:SAM-dependent methyltransferase